MENEIRVVIADDEEGMRMILRKMIAKAEGFTLCAEATNGIDLLKLVEQYKPQVCFLDVEMPGMTGLECAKAIQDTDPRTIVVFATAHDDYMAQAFEVYAFDYMVKPFKVERVMKTLERIRSVKLCAPAGEKPAEPIKAPRVGAAAGGRIMLHHKEGVNFVNQADILLIQRCRLRITEHLLHTQDILQQNSLIAFGCWQDMVDDQIAKHTTFDL